jgi:fucose 4-O-acetylase-like acetyltransferase
MKKRLLPLDFAKGIAIIIIVWAHADLKMDPIFYETYLKIIHKAIYSFHIPLFFLISGILAKNTLEKSDFSLPVYIKNLCTRILMPYYALNIVFFLINILVPRSYTHAPSAVEMTKALLVMQSHPTYLPSGVLWFLFALFLCSLTNAIMLKQLKVNKYIWLGICLAITLSSTLLWDIYYLALDRFSRNIFFFVFGYVLSDMITGRDLKRTITLIPGLLCAWAIVFYFFYNGPFSWRILTGVVGSLCMLAISFAIDHGNENKNILQEGMHFIGRNSIIIFVLHMPVLLVVFKTLIWMHLTDSFLGFTIALLAGIIGPHLIALCLKVYPPLYRILLGKWPDGTHPSTLPLTKTEGLLLL